VELKICDLLGKVVFASDLGVLPAGNNQVQWTAINTTGTDLASGIYYYYFESETRSEVKKMVYLR
jgi:flagellar hook assembly protein FlgD